MIEDLFIATEDVKILRIGGIEQIDPSEFDWRLLIPTFLLTRTIVYGLGYRPELTRTTSNDGIRRNLRGISVQFHPHIVIGYSPVPRRPGVHPVYVGGHDLEDILPRLLSYSYCFRSAEPLLGVGTLPQVLSRLLTFCYRGHGLTVVARKNALFPQGALSVGTPQDPEL